MNREEHLEWAKSRAREYLDRGDAAQAVTSMLSDLSKHEELKGIADKMGAIGLFLCQGIDEARRFVEGFR